jgi:excisionase family DNA binding protein
MVPQTPDGSRTIPDRKTAQSRPERALTLSEVAEELGVHYMTVYKYVRQGRLPASKQGMQWLVSHSDLDLFRMSAEPQQPTESKRRRAPWPARLEDRLLAGDNPGAWDIVASALSAGKSPTNILIDVLAPALCSIGARWAQGEISVADEHRASTVAARLLGRLSPRFTRPGHPRGTVIVGTAPGELHSLPVSILADVLRGAGYAVIDLGCNLPVDSLASTVANAVADNLVAVMLSATNPHLEDEVRASVTAIRQVAPSIPVYIGGSGMDAERAARLGADGSGHNALEALDHLEAEKAGVGASV